MGSRLADFGAYAHLWATPTLRDVFAEQAVYQRWLDVLVALAEVQAELDIVPRSAAAAIAEHADASGLDLDRVAAATRTTGHSTLGLIQELQRLLPDDAARWVYYGATVQDVTDTATAIALREVARAVHDDLRGIEAECLRLSVAHRDTPMVGRTHGQAGSPITFGWKAAGWADEVRRHIERLREGAPRWTAGQLGGAVGTLGFFEERGIELRTRFCARLGLTDPGISWLAARDRIAEFGAVSALISATTARIGNEVLQLQRGEIGEVRESRPPDAVGSITMPHKRNPERAEHLVTLSRLVRANATVLLEGMVSEHERDARGWKAEWVALPEVCLLTGAATSMCRAMLEELEVDADAMLRGVWATHGRFASERLLAQLSPTLGKHEAQRLLQELFASGTADPGELSRSLAADPRLADLFREDVLVELLARPDVGAAGVMVDEVVARAHRARVADPEHWP